MRKILVTGTAGFIGFHLAKHLLAENMQVHGFDGMTEYYDSSLKNRRHQILLQNEKFSTSIGMLEDDAFLTKTIEDFEPDVIVHLAAQPGVRYSLENPRSYIESNIVGTFNIMEAARKMGVQHLLMASTSSVYGGNTKMPFCETEKADTPLTIYAATKKATEAMAHSYAHLWKIPTTMFRFFTVYGSWGRPDLAPHKFVDAILDNRPIDVYNFGEMYRDFTFVHDVVRGIHLLMDAVPPETDTPEQIPAWDSLSPVAPFRVVNIGNSEKIHLLDFIEAIEHCVGKPAIRNLMEMQKGDVPATWANADLLYNLTGYRPNTDLKEGMAEFVDWFRDYYEK